MSKNRNRSRSGAQTECPHCKKKLRGVKGTLTHIKEMHSLEAAENYDFEIRKKMAGDKFYGLVKKRKMTK